jgi:ABC-type spermidine/putrescine transport system permease subunit II
MSGAADLNRNRAVDWALIVHVVLAYAFVFAPFAMAIIRLRLSRMDPALEPAAWNLGASE